MHNNDLSELKIVEESTAIAFTITSTGTWIWSPTALDFEDSDLIEITVSNNVQSALGGIHIVCLFGSIGNTSYPTYAVADASDSHCILIAKASDGKIGAFLGADARQTINYVRVKKIKLNN